MIQITTVVFKAFYYKNENHYFQIFNEYLDKAGVSMEVFFKYLMFADELNHKENMPWDAIVFEKFIRNNMAFLSKHQRLKILVQSLEKSDAEKRAFSKKESMEEAIEYCRPDWYIFYKKQYKLNLADLKSIVENSDCYQIITKYTPSKELLIFDELALIELISGYGTVYKDDDLTEPESKILAYGLAKFYISIVAKKAFSGTIALLRMTNKLIKQYGLGKLAFQKILLDALVAEFGSKEGYINAWTNFGSKLLPVKPEDVARYLQKF